PRGYYLALPGAESLVGWHVNRGWNDAAEFFPVGRFREQFNRPDVVKLVLELQDEEKAVAEANRRAGLARSNDGLRASPPPPAAILSPEDNAGFGEQEVAIWYKSFSPTGKPITGISSGWVTGTAGAPLVARAAPVPVNAKGEMRVSLPPEDVTVSLTA